MLARPSGARGNPRGAREKRRKIVAEPDNPPVGLRRAAACEAFTRSAREYDQTNAEGALRKADQQLSAEAVRGAAGCAAGVLGWRYGPDRHRRQPVPDVRLSKRNDRRTEFHLLPWVVK